MRRFENCHAVVTGGSAGIGLEIVRKLKSEGASVTVLDINPCTEAHTFVETNLADRGAVVATAEGLPSGIGALFNCAGVPPRVGNEALVLDLNFFGLRALTLGMLEKLRDGAAIVNLASLAGSEWKANITEVRALLAMAQDAAGAEAAKDLGIDATRAYNLSKEAVIAWTVQQTAKVLPRGIRMNSVCPAAVSTGILDDFKAAFGPRVAAAIERSGRATTPDEVADLALFLASDASHWIKGGEFKIDGGIESFRLADALELG